MTGASDEAGADVARATRPPGTMAVGSFLSGGLLAAYGWDAVLWLSFVPLALAVVALPAASSARRSEAAG